MTRRSSRRSDAHQANHGIGPGGDPRRHGLHPDRRPVGERAGLAAAGRLAAAGQHGTLDACRRPRRRRRSPSIRPRPSSRTSKPNAEIGFWTFFLSPTFDGYIKDTIARFEATYPGVKVNWEDHQATFQDDLNNAFSAGNAPDVINLSVGEGWVADYATRGLLLDLDATVPQEVKDIYFEGLWKSQLVDGKNFQFPWYQGIAVELINKRIYEEGAGLAVADFPKTIDGLPAVCKTIKDKTGSLCDIRLTVNDLLAQMTYEGDVKVIADDGKSFTFDSPAGVAWLQMYVDMVKDGSVDTAALTTAGRPRRPADLLGRPGAVLPDRPEPHP